jgi:ABC-type metal ion transport system substrate-binding protein
MPIRRLAVLLLCLGLAACIKPRGAQLDTLIVAADPERHAAMLEAIKPALAEQGVGLEIEVAKDGPAMQDAVLSGRADAALGPMRAGVDRLNAGGGPKLAKITPVDRPGLESNEGPHVAYLVARADRAKDLRLQKLASVLTTPAVKSFIQDRFSGAVQPAF